jgi:hypothetical protein
MGQGSDEKRFASFSEAGTGRNRLKPAVNQSLSQSSLVQSFSSVE